LGSETYLCWKCGNNLGDIPLPLGREAKCKACRAHLHCCRICSFYDTTVSNHCREPIAEKVNDKTRSNFCGYLKLNPKAYQEIDKSVSNDSQSELDALFGIDTSTTKASTTEDEKLKQLNDLFDTDD
jgi:hypothetical protein